MAKNRAMEPHGLGNRYSKWERGMIRVWPFFVAMPKRFSVASRTFKSAVQSRLHGEVENVCRPNEQPLSNPNVVKSQ